MSKKVEKYILKEELTGKEVGRYHSKKKLATEGIGCTEFWFHKNSNDDKTRMVFNGIAYLIINVDVSTRFKVLVGDKETFYSTKPEIINMIGCGRAWFYQELNATSSVKFQGVTYNIIDTLKK